MKEKEPKLIIIGSGHLVGLTAMRMAEIKAMNLPIEVVKFEEAQERGLTETFEYKLPSPLPELQEVILKQNFFGDGKSNRNKRRKAERKAKKGKR